MNMWPLFALSFLLSSTAFAQEASEAPPLPEAEPAFSAPLPDFASPQQPPAPAPGGTLPPSADAPPAGADAIPGTPSTTVTNLLKEFYAAAPGNIEASYGNREHSLFLSKTDSGNIRHILRLYESGSIREPQPIDSGVAELLQDLQPKEEPKNLVYPRFKLRSIIYSSPAEWVVLLNENRISSYNNSAERELTVLNVTKSSVSFRWKPMDEVLLASISGNAAGPIPANGASNNRAAKDARTSYDTNARAVFFTLSVNQDFNSQTFEVTEGGPLKKKKTEDESEETGETTTPSIPAINPDASVSRPSMIPQIPQVIAPSPTTQSGNSAETPIPPQPVTGQAVPQSAILKSLGLD